VVKISEKQSLLSREECAITKVTDALQACKEELEDHRLAINENTNEIASNSEAISEIFARLDKISGRIDELFEFVKGRKIVSEKPSVKPLSKNEKKVFHSLYSLTEQYPAVCYDQLSAHSKLCRNTVNYCVASMCQKGVPILKRYRENKAFVFLDPAFKELQAKENVVGLTVPLNYWC